MGQPTGTARGLGNLPVRPAHLRSDPPARLTRAAPPPLGDRSGPSSECGSWGCPWSLLPSHGAQPRPPCSPHSACDVRLGPPHLPPPSWPRRSGSCHFYEVVKGVAAASEGDVVRTTCTGSGAGPAPPRAGPCVSPAPSFARAEFTCIPSLSGDQWAVGPSAGRRRVPAAAGGCVLAGGAGQRGAYGV